MMILTPLLRQSLLLALESKSTLRLCEKATYFKIIQTNRNSLVRLDYHFYSTDSNKQKDEITKVDPSEVSTTIHTVKETTKTASYTGVIIIGLGITGMLFYTVFRELFSSNSPNTVYSNTLDRCLKDSKIIDMLGEPLKGYGEETRRGRRRHTSHLLYEKDGINYLRMKFYIKGSRRKATVHLEMKENDKKKFEYRYLFVQLDDYPHTTFVLEDNRAQESLVPLPSLLDSPLMN